MAGGIVRNAQREDGFTFGEDQARVGAAGPGAVGGEVGHLAVIAARQPVFEKLYVRRGVGSRHAGQDESQPARFFEDGLFESVGH
ncbi:MAG TPA: hypothetical protein PKV01_13955 [Anaerolineales bacterium]|nr:hypothetical protein [Anaerolineales bacterium]